MQFALCDDDPIALEKINRMLKNFAEKNQTGDIYIYTFSSPNHLLDAMEEGRKFDIYLLDIIMPNYDGINMGRIIRKEDENACIIYLTSSLDFALESYKVSALQYLIKPISEEILFSVLERAVTILNIENSMRLIVRTRDGLTAIPHRKIAWVEYVNHSVCVHLNDDTMIWSVSLRESFDSTMAELLKNNRFIKCHMSYILNMDFIQSITAHDFLLEDKTIIPISRKNYKVVKKEYIDYLLKWG